MIEYGCVYLGNNGALTREWRYDILIWSQGYPNAEIDSHLCRSKMVWFPNFPSLRFPLPFDTDNELDTDGELDNIGQHALILARLLDSLLYR